MSDTDWSAAWESSSQPGKQRKHQYEAPHHQQKKFLNARLADNLRDRVGTKTLPVRSGDTVEIVRGDFAGTKSSVARVDRDEHTLYLESVDRETVSGSDTKIPINPSNVVITKLELEDDRRVAKYDVSEAEREEISVDHDEEEADAAADEPEETADIDGAADDGDDIDYDELADNTISNIKERANEEDLDYALLLEAEQDGKERKTLIEWIERRINDE